MKRIIFIVVLLLVAISFVLINSDQANESQLTEAEIREKFFCDDRFIDVVYATDIYCINPEYYYQDARDGSVIEQSDYDDPRYKSIFENQ